MERVAHTLAALLRGPTKSQGHIASSLLVREITTARASYRVRGSLAGAGLMGPGTALLVLLEQTSPDLPSDAAIQERFGLTRKEARVALLMAEGKSNEEIAKALFISFHTARHHTEQVRLKLGVKSRAEVGPILLRG